MGFNSLLQQTLSLFNVFHEKLCFDALSDSLPALPRVFIVLNHSETSKKKSSEKNGRTRFIFSITSIVSTRQQQTLPGSVWPPTLPPGVVWKSIFLRRSCAFLPGLSALNSAPVVFRCTHRHLASKLSSSSSALRGSLLPLARLLQTKGMCVLTILLFLLPLPSDIYIYSGFRVFSKLFAPKRPTPDALIPRRRLTLNFSQQQRTLAAVMPCRLSNDVCAVVQRVAAPCCFPVCASVPQLFCHTPSANLN